ncbi:hypothetical protein FB451DRAFT_1557079 [Mycena latifolia]|nr:hypothetical protein FB451DRAFT_1557079 [Mycena latifolia]
MIYHCCSASLVDHASLLTPKVPNCAFAARCSFPTTPFKPLHRYAPTLPPASIARASSCWSTAGISTAWGIALAIFATGVVPIYWGISEYGRLHSGLTNVIVTGIATLATAHLKYTVRRVAEEYAAMRLANGLPLIALGWLQGVAAGDIWPPLQSAWTWCVWLLLFGGMAVHSASIVAILQPHMSDVSLSYVIFAHGVSSSASAQRYSMTMFTTTG